MSVPNERPQNELSYNPQVFRVEQDTIDATTAWELRPQLLHALHAHGPNMLLDLCRVNFIDSTGLGMLVGLLKEAREMNGNIRLVNASREVHRILQVTGLEALFEQQTETSAAVTR